MPKKVEATGSGESANPSAKKVKLAEITNGDPKNKDSKKEYVVPELEGVTEFHGHEIYYYYGKKASKNGSLIKANGKEIEVVGFCHNSPDTLKISEVEVAP